MLFYAFLQFLAFLLYRTYYTDELNLFYLVFRSIHFDVSLRYVFCFSVLVMEPCGTIRFKSHKINIGISLKFEGTGCNN